MIDLNLQTPWWFPHLPCLRSSTIAASSAQGPKGICSAPENIGSAIVVEYCCCKSNCGVFDHIGASIASGAAMGLLIPSLIGSCAARNS